MEETDSKVDCNIKNGESKQDDDKNIHVPKDKKLKIEYVSVKNAFVHNDVVFYDIHVKTSQHYWHVTKRYNNIYIYIYMMRNCGCCILITDTHNLKIYIINYYK